MSNIVDEIVEEPAKYAFPLIVVIAAIVFYYQMGKVNETNAKIAVQLGIIDKKLESIDEKFVKIGRELGSIDGAILKVDGAILKVIGSSSRYSYPEVNLSTIDKKLVEIETAIRFRR